MLASNAKTAVVGAIAAAHDVLHVSLPCVIENQSAPGGWRFGFGPLLLLAWAGLIRYRCTCPDLLPVGHRLSADNLVPFAKPLAWSGWPGRCLLTLSLRFAAME